MTDTGSGSLREQLGAPADPEFSLVLPPGWSRRDVSHETEESMLQAARKRLMQVHRPDLYGQLQSQLRQSFAQMRQVGTIAHFGPDEDAPDAAFLPASLTASIVTPGTGRSLVEEVTDLIRGGATDLGGDRRFVRLERETHTSAGGQSAKQTTVAYLTPVPGSKQSRALQLTAVITRGAEFPDDDPALLTMKSLFDATVATLAWEDA